MQPYQRWCCVRRPQRLLPLFYSHVFETVSDDKPAQAEVKAAEQQVKLAEQLLESLKKKQ